MAAYRIKFADALSDRPVDEFDLTGVTAEVRLGAAGALQGSIPIARGDTTTGARIAAVASSGGSAAYVYRNGVPWWAGLLWTKNRASDDHSTPACDVAAATFESYLDRVQLGTDLTPLPGTDQLAIARSLLDHMQTDPHSNLHITYDPAVTSGILRDRVLYLAAARPTYLKMLTDLANLDQGFEFTFGAITDPTTGIRTRRMTLGYPILTTGTVHHITKPGNILSYTWPEDGTRGATYLMATGASAQSSIHIDTAALNAGYPRLDATTSYSSITDPAVLNAHASADLALARVPVSVPAIRVRLDDTDLTPQSLGDTIRVAIHDELFPAGVTASFRLVGMTVAPPERGRPETCDLILN